MATVLVHRSLFAWNGCWHRPGRPRRHSAYGVYISTYSVYVCRVSMYIHMYLCTQLATLQVPGPSGDAVGAAWWGVGGRKARRSDTVPTAVFDNEGTEATADSCLHACICMYPPPRGPG